MSSINILIAPDVAPKHLAGWHILNTNLQKISNQAIHLDIAFSATEQFKEIQEKNIDLIYANPFDASYLVRKLSYQAVAKPIDKFDEMVIVSAEGSPVKQLSDLKKGNTIITSGNKDIILIGLRLLEAVDLEEKDFNWIEAENYQAATKMVIDKQSDITFLLLDNYQDFSKMTRDKLHVLVESAMRSSTHVFLAKEKNEATMAVVEALIKLTNDEDKRWIFEKLGIPKGFERTDQEKIEFMIDIIDTLID